MAAADNAVVGIEELTVHGWDLARSTGQDQRIDDASLDQVDTFFTLFAEQIATGQGPFGPEVPAPDGASRVERTVARTGRDPRGNRLPDQQPDARRPYGLGNRQAREVGVEQTQGDVVPARLDATWLGEGRTEPGDVPDVDLALDGPVADAALEELPDRRMQCRLHLPRAIGLHSRPSG